MFLVIGEKPSVFQALAKVLKAEISCGGHIFSASGKTVAHNGWKDFEDILKRSFKDAEDMAEKEATENGGVPETAENRKGGKLPECDVEPPGQFL